MKATSSCSMRSWSPCGRRPTTATAAATSPLSWSSKTPPPENPSSSEPCRTRRGSSRPGPPRRTSCERAQTDDHGPASAACSRSEKRLRPHAPIYSCVFAVKDLLLVLTCSRLMLAASPFHAKLVLHSLTLRLSNIWNLFMCF